MGERGIKFLLFIFIILVVNPQLVFAQSINSDSYSQKDSFNNSSRYDFTTSNTLGDDMSLLSVGTIGTRYNGKSYYFQFNFHKSLTANKFYELKVSSTTSDFTSNINKDDIVPLCYSSFAYNFNTKECGDISIISVIRGTGTQSKDFTIRFSPLSSMTYWGFKFGGGFNALTGVNNFLVNNFDLTEVNADNTDELINNQNQNAQDIIDNQNQNSQDIIDNQNQNANKITDAINSGFNNVCGNIIEIKNIGNCKFANDSADLITCSTQITDTNSFNGSVSFNYNAGQWRGFNTNNYYNVKPNTRYYFGFTTGATGQVFYGKVDYYNSNKQFISQNTISFSSSSGSNSWITPNNASYVRFSFETTDPGTYTFSNIYYSTSNSYCAFGSSTSKLDETNNSINNVNDSLTNSSIDNGTGSDFFSNFTTSDNGGISAIVSKPLIIINNLLSNNGQCTNLTLPSFMGVSNATLPSGCILWNSASTVMITLWNTFVCGLGSYFILKDIFRIIEDLKNPDNDKVEVMDL